MRIRIHVKAEGELPGIKIKLFKSYSKAAEFFIDNYHLILGGSIEYHKERVPFDRSGLYRVFKRLGYYEPHAK